MTSAVDYLVVTVVHRTNEDWFLTLPLAIDDLVGAVAICQLINKNGDTISLNATIEDKNIVLRGQSEIFDTKSGPYAGDVLVTLSGGRDLVTHLINLELQKGISRRG